MFPCGQRALGMLCNSKVYFLPRYMVRPACSSYSAYITVLFKQDDKRAFLERVEACVRESQETVYENEEGSSLRFTEPKPAHVCFFIKLRCHLASG